MELLFEFVLELMMSLGQNKRIPRIVRLLILLLVFLFFLLIIGIVFYAGMLMSKENILAALFCLGIGVFMLVGTFEKFSKMIK